MTLPPSIHALNKQARKILAQWNIQPFGDIFLSQQGGHLEHLLHECAHASLLNIPIGPDMSTAINKNIHAMGGELSDSLLGRHSAAALREEARAWAVEWLVIQRLHGLPIEWGDVDAAADVQGVDADQQVKPLLTDPEIAQHADRCFHFLLRLP